MADTKIIVYYVPPAWAPKGKPQYSFENKTGRGIPVTAWLPEPYALVEENGKIGVICPGGTKTFEFGVIGWKNKPAIEHKVRLSDKPQINGKAARSKLVRIELDCLDLSYRQKIAAYKLKAPAPRQFPWVLDLAAIPEGVEYTKETLYLPHEVKLKRRGRNGELFFEKDTLINVSKVRTVSPDTSKNFDGITEDGRLYFDVRLSTTQEGQQRVYCILSEPNDFWFGEPKNRLTRDDFLTGTEYIDTLVMNEDGTSVYVQTMRQKVKNLI